jgi:hypothetical protein
LGGSSSISRSLRGGSNSRSNGSTSTSHNPPSSLLEISLCAGVSAEKATAGCQDVASFEFNNISINSQAFLLFFRFWHGTDQVGCLLSRYAKVCIVTILGYGNQV